MKSLIAFSQVLLTECGERCGVSTARDSKTIACRVEHEGISFLTISLANFGADLQKGLDQGFVDSSLFLGFSRTGGLPRFLGGFLCRVFDRSSGRLLDSPDIEVIRCLRQFLLAFAKVNLECTGARKARAIAGYVQCEKDIREADKEFPRFKREFSRMSALLFGDVFDKVDRMVRLGEILPKHGSGSTADHTLGNAKWNDFKWTRRLDSVFPVMDYLVPTYRHLEVLDRVDVLEPGDEEPVRVILVPKTLKTPRVIAMEPVCMMFMQQGLMQPLVDLIDRDDLLRSIVGNLDQEPNRRLARVGSIDGSLATLDLSEASDRVSNQHVLAMLQPWPNLSEAVQATRSRKADVPGHGVIRLAKFASMGSALCFVMEMLVFTTIVFLAIQDVLNRPLTHADFHRFKGRVRVYGDDIVVPVEYFQQVIMRLESFGMRVNTRKSYGVGRFRESCGGDYYCGVDVTPVRVRSVFPRSSAHVEEIVKTVSLRNHLFDRGWVRTVEYLDQRLDRCIKPYVDVPRDSSAIGRWSYSPIQAESFHADLQVPLIKAPVLVSKPRRDILSGYGALLKFLMKGSVEPNPDPRHLEHAGRPVSARIVTRWVALR